MFFNVFVSLTTLTLVNAYTGNNVATNINFQHAFTKHSVHPTLGYAVQKTTFRSQALPLNPGQVVFTNPADTPMPMPTGTYAILGFVGEVIDSQNKSVPLSTVYDHHWIALDKFHDNVVCTSSGDSRGPQYVFGIGAESRNTPANFPDGQGYHVYNADENQWGANIHLLHTVDLEGSSPAAAAKQCNECYYAPGKGPQCTVANNGTFMCCGDACYSGICKCPTKPGTKMIPTDYYLSYTVTYTYDVEVIAPIGIGVYTTPNCRLYYGVERNDTNPYSVSRTSFTVEEDAEIVYAVGHLHTGGVNISMYVNDEYVCTSYPTYGTDPSNTAGNEKGYLVKMSYCFSQNETTPSVKVQKGDTIDIEGIYYVGSNDERLVYSDGTHLNVMAYMYTAYQLKDPKQNTTAPSPPSCASKLIELCGKVIGFQGQCDDCATTNANELGKAGCKRHGVVKACAKKWYKDNGRPMFEKKQEQQQQQQGEEDYSFSSSPASCPTVEIANGVHMPLVSLGHPDGASRGGNATINETSALELWLSSAVNGTGIDTALIYQNQDQVGAAMRASGRSRASMFLVTKIPNVLSRKAMVEAVRKDIAQMGETPDVVLIHTPCSSGFVSHGCVHATTAEIKEAWLGMEDVLKLGLSRAIGVSNFGVEDLQPIVNLNGTLPSLNQCEMYVGNHDDSTIQFCHEHGIQYEAYSPLGRGSLNVQDVRIQTIAKAHDMSVYQVCLRWITQQNIPMALSTTKLEHDLSDLTSCNFVLTKKEMTILSSI